MSMQGSTSGSWVEDELSAKDARYVRATVANKRYDERREQIRNNDRLTDDEKRRLIAAEWVRAFDEIAAAREAVTAEAARELQALKLKRLGAPSLPVGAGPEEALVRRTSYRDALERADRRETAPDLERLLRQAVLSGDKEQEQAALVVAMTRVLTNLGGKSKVEDGNPLTVVNAYLENHPAEEADLQRIIDLTAVVDHSSNAGTKASLRDDMRFAAPAFPSETGAVSEADVRRLAAKAPQPRGSAEPFNVS